MNYNKVLLIGRLTRDPELRYLQNGSPVCNFGFATSRRYKRQDGEFAEDTCFVDITVWGRQGENVNEYLKKGSPAIIDGRLTFESWETEGQRRSKLSVTAENVQFFPRNMQGGDGGGGGGGGGRGSGGQVSDYGGNYQQYESPGAGGADADVPF